MSFFKKKAGGEKRKKKRSFLFFFFVAIAAAVVAGAAYLVILVRELPSPDQFSIQQISQSTKIYDRTGTVLLYEIHGDEKRTVVPFNEIPDAVKKTTIVAEDANFYTEPAFDWKGIARAILTDIEQGQFAQGGSTITQQLAKNVFLNSEKTFSRKIKELILAIELESKYTKDEILSFYLNQIPYGSNAYGVEAASQLYFGKSVRDLDLAEAAILASMLQAPSYYSPWGPNVDDLYTRQKYVLDRMATLGYASQADVDKAKSEKITFMPQTLGSIKAPHFSLFVKDYLINKYGEDTVLNGGLKVITTLDWNLQQIAESAVEDGSKNNEKLYGSKNAALVAEDPKTGQILAMVGSRDYFDISNDGNFNVATQGLRQPGSAMKPFVYLTAFEKGYSPTTVVFDVRTEFDTTGNPANSYRPQNFDNTVHGPVMLQNALAQSLNIPAVKVLYLAGIQNSLDTLHAFGITTLQETWRYGLSLVLGGGEVKLVDLVNAYATLSQEGVHHDQSSILEIDDANGNVLENYHDNATRVLDDPQYAREVTQILSSADLRKPIFQSSLGLTVFPGYDVALETGTSQDHRDAWTVGYTPFLVAGVWAGNNDNTPMIAQGDSILAAVPIWNLFFKQALTYYQPEPFTNPDPIPYDPKPMLNGSSVWSPVVNGVALPQVHSILYYVDRSDPTGPRPADPSQDPQFESWEGAVEGWAAENIPNYSNYNKPVPSDASFDLGGEGTSISSPNNPAPGAPPTILNVSPKNGAFASAPVTINALITSATGLKNVQLSVNGRLIYSIAAIGTSFPFSYTYRLPLDAQDSFEIKAFDLNGNSSSAATIIYQQSSL